MRHLSILTCYLLGCCSVLGCTSTADVASKESASAGTTGNNTFVSQAGTANLPKGGTSSTATSDNGRGSTPVAGGSPSAGGNATTTAVGGASPGSSAGGKSTVPSLGGSGFGASATGGSADLGGASTAVASGGANLGGNVNLGGSANPATAGSASVDVQESRSDLAAITNPAVSDSEYSAFINDANAFGLKLNQAVVTDSKLADKNSVFSPTSAQVALAMTYGGAVGDTAAAMKAALQDNLGGTKYHAACNRLLRDLASRNSSRTDSQGNAYRIELAPANSLWAERTVAVKTNFLDLLAQQYDAGMKRVDFIGQPDPSRLAINAWVEQHTHDRIKDLLMPGDIDGSTRFVLVNALYLFASWQTLFDENATKQAAFHPLSGSDVQVATMALSEEMPYASTASADVVQIPYTTGNLWMTVVVPKSGQFEAVRSLVSSDWLASVTSGLTTTNVRLSLPKFKIQTDQLKLTKPLTQLGMGIIFSGPDFSGITDMPLFVSDVIQKAFIGVDEDGTEATAATAVMLAGAIPVTPVPVTIDRPFLYFIQDKTGLVLFAGHVVNPSI